MHIRLLHIVALSALWPLCGMHNQNRISYCILRDERNLMKCAYVPLDKNRLQAKLAVVPSMTGKGFEIRAIRHGDLITDYEGIMGDLTLLVKNLTYGIKAKYLYTNLNHALKDLSKYEIK